MKYEHTTSAYNDRRYGQPWLAVVGDSLRANFRFLNWTGRPGCAGVFEFSVEPGTILAAGQKDNRKGRGGVDTYYIAMPDGRLEILTSVQLVIHTIARAERVAAYARMEVERLRKLGPYDSGFKRRWIEMDRLNLVAGVANPLAYRAAQALMPQPEVVPQVRTLPSIEAFF